jgi:glycogen debranching enzyme
VEIQALWFNALRIYQYFAGTLGKPFETYRQIGRAHTISASFVAVTFIYKETPPPAPTAPRGPRPPKAGG